MSTREEDEGMMQTTGKLIGATVYALNLTHGLAPSRPRGDFETVVQADDYNGAVMTAEGNYYSLTNYGIQSYAERAAREQAT